MTVQATDLFTVDKVKGVIVEKKKYLNDIGMLTSLRSGMTTLYNQCRPREFELTKKFNNQPVVILIAPQYISNDFRAILPCYFHWFSVSLCNYARLAGYIEGLENGAFTKADKKNDPGKIKKHCTAYVNSIPEIQDAYKWRNKVSAHFALTDPKGDNHVTMNVSALNMTGFVNDRFVSKAMSVNTTDGVTGATLADDLPTWSITQTFETLVARFWPDVIIPTGEIQKTN